MRPTTVPSSSVSGMRVLSSPSETSAVIVTNAVEPAAARALYIWPNMTGLPPMMTQSPFRDNALVATALKSVVLAGNVTTS